MNPDVRQGGQRRFFDNVEWVTNLFLLPWVPSSLQKIHNKLSLYSRKEFNLNSHEVIAAIIGDILLFLFRRLHQWFLWPEFLELCFSISVIFNALQLKFLCLTSFLLLLVVVVVKDLNYFSRDTKVAKQNVHKTDVMEQIKQKRKNLKFMLYSCCIYSGSSKSMNYYSQIFGLSVSLIFSLCQIWKLNVIKKTRKVLVIGHLLRHSLLFRSWKKRFLRWSLLTARD